MATLERAIAIAAQAHAGQVDKAGAPYILHPLRVMLRLGGLEERIVGVLHDLIEDTPWTLEGLRAEGFSDAVLTGIQAVTRAPNETYEAFVLRAKLDPLGRPVKLADLADNLDVSRLANPTAKDFERLERYRQAQSVLEAE